MATMCERGGGSSVGRAPGCGPGGRGFESHSPPFTRLTERHQGALGETGEAFVTLRFAGRLRLSWPRSSVDRAADFESACRRFDSSRGHCDPTGECRASRDLRSILGVERVASLDKRLERRLHCDYARRVQCLGREHADAVLWPLRVANLRHAHAHANQLVGSHRSLHLKRHPTSGNEGDIRRQPVPHEAVGGRERVQAARDDSPKERRVG